MTAQKKLQFPLNIKHATSRVVSKDTSKEWQCVHFLKWKGLSKQRFYCVLSVAIIYSSEMNKLYILESWWQKVEKLKILCDYFDWYFLMIYCLVFINWLMIDVDHNIKARLQWIKTVDSHEFGKSVLNTIMGEIKLCLIPTRTEHSF